MFDKAVLRWVQITGRDVRLRSNTYITRARQSAGRRQSKAIGKYNRKHAWST
jgi:hypothetical protein